MENNSCKNSLIMVNYPSMSERLLLQDNLEGGENNG
jgi:hypothetical protein